MENKLNILKWVLALAIVIVLNLFFAFAIRLGYKEPIYETFCPQVQVHTEITNEKACTNVGGQWNDYGTAQVYGKFRTVPTLESPVPLPTGYCNEQYTCGKGYESATSIYNRNVFVVLIILGVVSLGLGYIIAVSSAVSLGLSLGGVIALVIASVRYWSDMDDILRVVILAIALTALIVFGIKKFKD